MSSGIPTLVGAPFSTFTRTMRMALEHLNVKYNFELAGPHSELAKKCNSFGRIPSLLHQNRVIFETMAIRHYVDKTFGDQLSPQDLDTLLKVDQIISVLCDYIFHHVVFGIAKPRHQYEDDGKSEQEIVELLKNNLKKAGGIIKRTDTLIDEKGPFLCGSTLTWADYFVYPAMADLYALPEGKFFAQQGPKLYHWYKNFETRQEVTVTYPETIADIRSRRASL